MYGYTGNILFIDLSTRKTKVRKLSPGITTALLGGKGLGAQLLYDLLPAGTDPFDPRNPLIYATGPLTATSAPAMRGCIVTKSPLTNTFCDSYFGGFFTQEMKYAGYDAIIIIGQSEKPIYLLIVDAKVEFKDAEHLWGMNTYETYDAVKNELNNRSVRISCIGPAGENMVKFALVDCDFHRQAGRGGIGAIFGAKRLKAIAIKGTGGIRVADSEKFEETVLKAGEEIGKSSISQELHSFGSVSGLSFANKMGFLPVHNFRGGSFPQIDAIDADRQKKYLWLQDVACAACPIACGKLGIIRKGKYKGEICEGVEYETVGLIGSNLGITDINALSYISKLCDQLGLDTISVGNVIGFVMEALEKNILSSSEVDNINLKFGSPEGIIQLINKIARREGIGNILADGVKIAADKIGNNAEEFAIHVKGLELPAWGPRGSVGMGLAYITGDRGGCHQRAWPIAYEQGESWPGGIPLKPLSIDKKAEVVIWEQNHLSALYSLSVCFYGTTGISTNTYLQLLAACTGLKLKMQEFLRIGERIWNIIRLFNLREGLEKKDDKLPSRFFKEPLPDGPMKGHQFDQNEVEKMLQEYYFLRGWDEYGQPTSDKITELGLNEILS